MVTAVGYLIELQSGRPWESFVREQILDSLGMSATSYSISDMQKQQYVVGFTEKRDSFEIYRIPYYEDTAGMAPCGRLYRTLRTCRLG
jgi:CubicO group peptidase (beta-lactamase class C family)